MAWAFSVVVVVLLVVVGWWQFGKLWAGSFLPVLVQVLRCDVCTYWPCGL